MYKPYKEGINIRCNKSIDLIGLGNKFVCLTKCMVIDYEYIYSMTF